MPACDADVAADALANILLATLVDFSRQKRISDGGARGADEIENAAANLRDHGVGRCEAADPDDGPRRQALDEINDRFMTGFGGEARRRAIGRARIQFDVPQVRDLGEQLNDFVCFGGGALALAAAKFLETDAQRHRARIASRIAGYVKQFAYQAHPIGNAATIRIRASIPFGQQELVRQVAHTGVHVDDVEPGALGAARRIKLPAAQIGNIGRVHDFRALIAHEANVCGHPRHARRRKRRHPARAIGYRAAAVPQLHARESAVSVHGIRHEGVRTHVVLVPECRVRQWRVVGGRMDRDVARTHHAPATLGLHAAKSRAHPRHRIRHAARMRNRIEAIRSAHGPDAHRLKEDIKSRISRHAAPASAENRV